jgi:sugar porter (SP) family MFS transporter
MEAHFQNCDPTFSSSMFSNCIHCSLLEWSFVVGAFCIGGLIGALSAPYITNTIGRKKVLLYHNLMYIFGTLFLVLATHPALLVVGRFLIGIACGICTVAVPMYLAEIAPDNARGLLGIMFQSAIVLGIFFSQVIGLGIDVDYWRVLFGIGGILPFIQMALIPFFVESPKWLAERQLEQDCVNSLTKLRKGIPSEHVHQEAQVMLAKSAGTDASQAYSLRRLFTAPEAAVSLMVGMIFHACQQLSGINAVFYFGGSIFAGLGLPAKQIFVGVTGWNILMTGVSIYLIDRFGRRPLILMSAALMVLADVFLILGANFTGWEAVSITFVLVFVGGFAIGLGPVPWVITGDIFPSAALSAGSMICVGTNWIANTIVALSFPALNQALKAYIFLPFAVITLVFFFFALAFFPETRGKSPGFIARK